MWTYEHVEATGASAESIWACYREPATWPRWDQAGSTVEVDFAAGAVGRFTPAGGRPRTFRITAVDDAGFTEVSRFGMARLTLRHDVTPLRSRITITGPFSAALGRLVGPRIAASQRAALRRLSVLALAADEQPPQ